MMKMMGRVPYVGNPMQQYQIEMSAFRQFKEEAMKAMKQQEVRIRNEKEKEIQLELNSIETRIKIKQTQLEAYKKSVSESAQNAAPQF